MIPFLYLFFYCIAGAELGMGIAELCKGNISNGLIDLAAALLIAGLTIWRHLKFLTRTKQAQQENQQKLDAFNRVLSQGNFSASNKIGDFWADYNQNLWCKNLLPVLFLFTDIVEVTINKTSSRKTTRYSSHSSHSSSHSYSSFTGSPSRSGYSSGSSRSTTNSIDTSTYTVFVKTKNLQFPVVEFFCDTDLVMANEIQSSINLILEKCNNENENQEQQLSFSQKETKNNALELKRYKSLLDDGVITQEEFEQKKKQILEL